jgi:hypothetical protein
MYVHQYRYQNQKYSVIYIPNNKTEQSGYFLKCREFVTDPRNPLPLNIPVAHGSLPCTQNPTNEPHPHPD